jgi:hypothetical protein
MLDYNLNKTTKTIKKTKKSDKEKFIPNGLKPVEIKQSKAKQEHIQVES